jgi:MFS family permease
MLAPTLTKWFTKRRGLVLGLGQMGGGLSFIYGLLAQYIIDKVDLRSAYLVLAGVTIMLLVPLHVLFFRSRPEDKGLKTYDAGACQLFAGKGATRDASATNVISSQEWTMNRVLRTRQLWLLVISLSLYWGVGGYLVLAHQIQFAQDVGFTSTFTASIFTLSGVFSALGSLSSAVSDWIGREKTFALATILGVSALIGLTSIKDTSQPWLFYACAIFLGFGGGICTPTVFAGAADMFHGRCLGTVSGLILLGLGIGGIVGPWLGGYIYDVSGSYTSAFILSMGCFVAAGIAFYFAAPRKAIKR